MWNPDIPKYVATLSRFYTFTKDSRFYIVKARKYRQNQLQIFTRHELIDTYFLYFLLNPSTLIAPGSIVSGKIGAIAFPSEFSIEIIF